MAVVLAATGASADNATNQTTLNVPYPSGISANDLLLLHVAAGATPTAPGGWTAFGSAAILSTTGAFQMVVYKLATGSESGSLAVTTASTTSHGRMYLYTGVDITTPKDVTPTERTVNANLVIDIASITTVTNGAMVVAFGSHANRANTYTQTTGTPAMTERDDPVQALGGSAGRSACHYSDVLATAGATGTVTLLGASTSARGLGILGALRPTVTATTATPLRHPATRLLPILTR